MTRLSNPTNPATRLIPPAGTVPTGGFRFMPRAAVGATVALLGFRFFRFISKYSVNIFFGDDWGNRTPFFLHTPGLRELFFEQWGPHREGLGLLADKFLYPVTKWNVRVDSFLIGGCIFAAMLLALLLKRKLFGPVSYSDGAIPVIFLTLAQFETLILAPNPAHSGYPLLLLMLYCLALLERNHLLQYGCVLAVNFLLIYTGFGLLMGPVTLGVFTLQCYWSLRRMSPIPASHPLAALLIAGASLGSFFAYYSWVDSVVRPYHPLVQYLWFMTMMFAAFVGPPRSGVFMAALGAMILLFATAILAFQVRRLLERNRSWHTALVGAVLLGYSLLFSASAALGRVGLGVGAGHSSRYVTLLIPAFLAMYFYLLSVPFPRIRKVGLALFVALLIPSALAVQDRARQFSDGKRAWAACYRRMEDIRSCDRVTHFQIIPVPDPTDLQQKLDYLKQHRLNLFAGPAGS